MLLYLHTAHVVLFCVHTERIIMHAHCVIMGTFIFYYLCTMHIAGFSIQIFGRGGISPEGGGMASDADATI